MQHCDMASLVTAFSLECMPKKRKKVPKARPHNERCNCHCIQVEHT